TALGHETMFLKVEWSSSPVLAWMCQKVRVDGKSSGARFNTRPQPLSALQNGPADFADDENTSRPAALRCTECQQPSGGQAPACTYLRSTCRLATSAPHRLWAQEVRPAESDPNDTVILSPFAVEAEGENGYRS